MDINYIWKITNLFTVNEKNINNVVVTADFVITGTFEDIAANVNGTTKFKYDNNKQFIPFENLTEQDVINWIKSEISEENINNLLINVANQIETIKNPLEIAKNQPLPWLSK